MKNAVLAILFFTSAALADTPVGPMNYQGRLLNNGIPVGYPTPTTANFVVRVYDAASGGILKYQETHNGVTVDDGVYSFLVGTTPKDAGDSTWSVELWNCCANLYMEITANGEVLLPRSRLAAAPYAFQANLALTTNNALALGGKPSDWYGSTLEAICVSGKGKWLELANNGAGACLGVGASYPGPTMVLLSALTANANLQNLDLTRADVSGIDFGAADLSGSVLKDTVVQPAGIDSVLLTGATLDHVLSINSGSVNANLSKAQIGNMDLGYWDLTGANLASVSTGMLTGCPAGLPAGFRCVGKDVGGGTWKYFLVGPGMNFSKNSLMSGRLNKQYTNQWSFNDATLTGIDYSENDLLSVIFPPYYTTDLSNSSFKGSNIRNMLLPGIMSGCVFDGATIKSAEFYGPTFAPVPPTFDGAELDFVLFNGPANNTILNFTNAVLGNIEIRGSGVPGYGQNISFAANTSRINTLAISSTLSSLTITNSTVVGGINAHPSSLLGTIVIGGPAGQGTTFMGGNISGLFYNANFSGSVFYGVSFRGAQLFGATGLLPSGLLNVDWFGATCPDGYQVTTPGGTCVGHGI